MKNSQDISLHMSPASKLPPLQWLGLSRNEIFAVGLIVGTANAIMPNIIGGVVKDGLIYSIANTFEISAIVWAAIVLGIHWSLFGDGKRISLTDRLAFLVIMASSFLPLGPFMWIFLTAYSLYAIFSSQRQGGLYRSGWIYLAITIPMFWSKRIFNIFADFFLSIDARLVSLITHTKRISNLVAMPDGSGYLQIAAPCSSMANVSLAVLCWVLFTQANGVRWKPENVFWCACACLAVVAINVTRISLIGFFPDHYELLHGQVGATVVSWLTIVAIFSVCYYGVKRGRFRYT
jgi:exosortase/archaeosortase family protein